MFQDLISKECIFMSKTVIIGGVAGGATAAARLRRRDESMAVSYTHLTLPTN